MPFHPPLLRQLREASGARVILTGPSGKDSLLCLHLLLEAGFSVECMFRRETLGGIPCVEEQTERWVETARRRYPKQLGALHYVLGRDAFAHVRQGVLRLAHFGEHPEVAEVTREEVEDAVRRDTGLEWVVDGTRVDEMQVSYYAANMRQMRGWFPEKRKCCLIWDLRKRELWDELARRGYPESSIEITGGARSMVASGFAREVTSRLRRGVCAREVTTAAREVTGAGGACPEGVAEREVRDCTRSRGGVGSLSRRL